MYEDVKVCKQRPFYRETTFFAFEYQLCIILRYSMILIPFLNIVAVLPHYVSLGRRWETGGHGEVGRWEKTSARRRYGAPTVQFQSISNMGVRVPSKRSPIECCARPPVPQVMKVCFTLVLGHRYETCTLVFYRGVFKKKQLPKVHSCPTIL